MAKISDFNYRSEIEKLTAKFASQLLEAMPEEYEDVLSNILKDLGEITNADRAYIFEFSDDEEFMSNTYEWCAKNVEPQIENLQSLECSIFPWWIKQIYNNQTIYIDHINNLPVEASAEKEILESQDIVSLVVLPIVSNEEVYGYFGIDNIDTANFFEENNKAILNILSKILSAFYKKYQMEMHIIYKNKMLKDSIQRIKEIQKDVVKREKYEVVKHLAAGVTHEINNALATIKSNVDILKSYHYDYLEKIIRKSEAIQNNEDITFVIDEIPYVYSDISGGFNRIEKLMVSVRELTAVNNNEMQYYKLSSIIKEAVMLYNSNPGRDITIILNFHSEYQFYCLKNDIIEVINNILKNSVESMKKNCMTSLEIKISTIQKDAYHIISIQDNAGGIKESIIDKVIDPFFTTKSINAGYGLGLSIAYDIIVGKYSGKLDIKSLDNQTTVDIYLPYDKAHT